MLVGTPDEVCSGVAYSFTPTTINGTGPFTYALDTGLPDGLTLNAVTGEISGIAEEQDVFDIVIVVTDANDNTFEYSFTLTVADCGEGELALTGTPDEACQEEPYSWTPVTEGGTGPYSYALDTVNGDPLPDGLTLDAETGEISGTPADQTESADIIIVVTDANEDTATLEVTLPVAECGV